MSSADMPSSSPPSRARSSPCPNDDALVSTPPSSPPPASQLPSQTKVIVQQRKDAFSVLGKRKAPLSAGDSNARPHKRSTTQATLKRKDFTMTQMHLSLGQKIEKRCKECGMVYVACSAEDRALHDQYHNQLSNGYDVGSQFVVKSTPIRVKQSKQLDECVCVVTRDDPPWKRKHARNVLNIITKCLGACDIPDEELWRPPADNSTRFEMWMYIRGTTCIAAALIETPLRNARRVMRPKREILEGAMPGSALERLRRRHEEASEQEDAPLVISEGLHTASMGICRIWTAPAFQKQGLAISMLDTMYQTWSSTTKTPVRGRINDIAFSQPTAAGTKLARKWFGKQSGWLVYS